MVALILAAIYIAFFHTLANPAHYAPFVALGKARKWSAFKTSLVAGFCGMGHLGAFIAVALIGIALNSFGEVLKKFVHFGEHLGFYLFLAFGILYLIYGLYFALEGYKKISEKCECEDSCCCGKLNARKVKKSDASLIAILFAFFALGPCEAILPLVLYPALDGNFISILAVAGAFYFTTILSMSIATFLIYRGFSFFFKGGKFAQRWGHFFSAIAIILAILLGAILH